MMSSRGAEKVSTKNDTGQVSVFLDSWCLCDQTNKPRLRVLSCLDLLQHSLRPSVLQYIEPSVSITPCPPTFSGVPRHRAFYYRDLSDALITVEQLM